MPRDADVLCAGLDPWRLLEELGCDARFSPADDDLGGEARIVHGRPRTQPKLDADRAILVT